MKILMVHPRLDLRGGAENLLCALSRGLHQRGHDIAVAVRRFDPKLFRDGAWDGITVHRLEDRKPTLRSRIRALSRASGWRRHQSTSSRRIAHHAERIAALSQHVDLVVAHNNPACAWATCTRARNRPRVVWYCHEPPARLHWRITLPTLVATAESHGRYPWLDDDARSFIAKQGLRPRRRAVDLQLDLEAVARVDGVLANSAFTAQAVSTTYGRSATVCHPGVPEPTRRWAPRAKPHVAWITSSLAHKNAAGFLEAIRIAVHERGVRDLTVHAVGVQTPEFQQRLHQKGLAENVVLEPRLSDAGIEELVATSRLVAYPSIDEPFGLVPIEAMAHGKAVLASDQGGPCEVVEPGVTGVLIDPLDPAAMAAGLVELWCDPDRAARLGAQGRARYQKDFSLDSFLDRFEAHIAGPATGA